MKDYEICDDCPVVVAASQLSTCEREGYLKEIEKLKILVKDAYNEGYNDGAIIPGYNWNNSGALKALHKKEIVCLRRKPKCY